MSPETPAELAEEGKRLYAGGQFEQAAALLRRAAEGYMQAGDPVQAAEMNNNLSVTLLQAGKPKPAWEAARGTEAVFASAGDRKREAMALANQAAALAEMGRADEALETYARSETLFAQLGEGDMLAYVKKSMAAIRLKHGAVLESALKMMGSVEAKSKPTLLERLLKFLMRFKPW